MRVGVVLSQQCRLVSEVSQTPRGVTLSHEFRCTFRRVVVSTEYGGVHDTIAKQKL